jgi:hypothetical protein
MTIQTLTEPELAFAFFTFEFQTDCQALDRLQATPQDLGYEVNEEELAGEMLAQLQRSPVDQTAPEIDPEEFETIYHWFLA